LTIAVFGKDDKSVFLLKIKNKGAYNPDVGNEAIDFL